MIDCGNLNITTSDVEHAIDEYVFNERNRKILKRTLIDGLSYEKVAEEFHMSVRQINNIMRKDGDRILRKFVPNI